MGSYASPVATKIFTPHRWHPALEGFDDFLRQLYRLDAHTITVLSGRRYRKTHSSELGRRIRENTPILPSSPRAEKARRLPQTLGQAHLGAPTENAPGQGGVNAAPRLLAGFGRAVARREVLAGNVLQQLVELVDAGLDAGSDVVRAGGRILLQG